MEIKLIIMAICAALFWLGGFCWLPARRFILPTLLTAYLLIVFHQPWLLLTLSVIGIFCLGYGDKSPLRHIFGDGWGRGVWGILAAICLSLPLLLTGNLSYVLFVPYLILNFTLENALKKLPQPLGDPIIGLGFSCIVLIAGIKVLI